MRAPDLRAFCAASGATLAWGAAGLRPRGVSTDSRSVRQGDLFVALRGPRFDGNAFAASALDAGALACLVESGRSPSPRPGRACLEVADPARALLDLAAAHRARFTLPVVGITGSCGKTTTKDYLAHLLGCRRRVVASEKSFNNAVGVPLTLLRIERGTEIAVLEIGTNAPGEIAALAAVARPTAGLVTNVNEAHLAGLGTVEGVAREKGDLLAALPEEGFGVISADCPRSRGLGSRTRARVLTVSVGGRADFRAVDPVAHGAGTAFLLNGTIPVTLPALGTHSVANLLFAIAACAGLGLPPEEVLGAVPTLPTAPRRLEWKRFGAISLLDDSYNANPASARAAVRVLAGMPGASRRVLVLGDMLELGESAPSLHAEVGAAVARAGIDLFIGVGREARGAVEAALAEGLPAKGALALEDTPSAVAIVPELLRDGDLVLVKGSRGMELESLVGALRGRFAPDGAGPAPAPSAAGGRRRGALASARGRGKG
ncbi:MAG TPA: UDP-N-acetylmuramoyl-tripeptide--D-alanyl-D-alanine ligase [Planctomycetota bacterium]|nr:UDP-N-acetylmuramoyl-tripeptide--D-alanyl-D-alanine ligase [Planctomycetota bacterium]